MSVKDANFCLSKDKQETVYSFLSKTKEYADTDFTGRIETEELRKNIWFAAHSGVKELMDLASMVIYFIVCQVYEPSFEKDEEGNVDPEKNRLLNVITDSITSYNGSDELMSFFSDKIQEKYPWMLTGQEKKELLAALQDVYNKMDHTKPKGTDTDEVRKMIYRAVHSEDDELFVRASLLAYSIIKVHYTKMAMKYRKQNFDVEEFTNGTLYIVVVENIKKYDGIHGLQTFFEPIVSAELSSMRFADRQMSKHYIDNSVVISRAEAQMKAMGVEIINPYNTSEYIRVTNGKHISPVTIERVHEYKRETESLDGIAEQVVDEKAVNPEIIFLKEEIIEDVQRTVNSLSDRHRKFFVELLQFTKEKGVMPKDTELHKICQKLNPGITREASRRLVTAAYNDFRRRYRKNDQKMSLRIV